MLKTDKLIHLNSGTQLKNSLTEKDVAVISVNPIEFHGPHLPLDTDHLISLGIVNLVEEKFKEKLNFYYFPAINMGVDPTPGPGTVSTSYQVLKLTILKIVKSLIRLGFKNFYFQTFHGAPLHIFAIDDVIIWLRKKGLKAINPFQLILNQMLFYNAQDFHELQIILTDLGHDQKIAAEVTRHLNFDFHGGLVETSLLLALGKSDVVHDFQSVKPVSLLLRKPKLNKIVSWLEKNKFKTLALEIDFINYVICWDQLKPFPGYTGNPQLSNQSIGQYLLNQHILPLYHKAILQEFLGDGCYLRPSFKMIKYLTLKGHLR